MGPANDEQPQDEDAFFLNVWAPPESAAGKPVLVFLHGGAFVTGGGSVRWHDGSRLAFAGLVVVTVNYRLGALGHLRGADPATRCLPLDDVMLALQWVREHITDYGGDPSRVTLVGHSAGGWYAHALSQSDAARGMFSQVALLSAGTVAPWSRQEQDAASLQVEPAVRADVGAGLESAPAAAVVRAGAAALAAPRGFADVFATLFRPTLLPGVPDELFDVERCAQRLHVDAAYIRYLPDEAGAFFFASPERHADRETILAWLSSETVRASGWAGTEVAAGEEYAELCRAASWLACGSLSTGLADAYAAAGVPTWLRTFALTSPLDGFGAGHCLDIPFQFGNRDRWRDAPMLEGIDEATFDRLSAFMIADLAAFASGTESETHEPGADPLDLAALPS